MSSKRLYRIPGIEAYTIAHVKYGVVRVTVAIAQRMGETWTAYACNYKTGHHGRDEISKLDIEYVEQFGKPIIADQAKEAFSCENGLWQLLNDNLGQYQELNPAK